MLTSLCYICSRPAITTCRICGRAVCSEHERNGICVNCLRGRKIS